MSRPSQWLTSRWGPIITGVAVGVLAPVLVRLGNPGNMGICVVCFSRDVAGALGFHRAAAVQYLRPELAGFVLGAFGAALAFREFRPRTGSAPIVRFLLGVFAAIGALVFLGCPWRAYLRLSGGDLNAIPGILGLVAGIYLGIVFLRQGFSLGRSYPASTATGLIAPALAVAMLVLVLVAPQLGRTAEGQPTGPVFFSESGPGSQHAPVLASLAVGLLVGALAQRSRFCTVGAVRDMILMRDSHLLNGIVALVIAALVTNLALGQFRLGIEGQPIAHSNVLWNLGGMVLAGLAFTLAGGCPGRQFFLWGEGDADSGLFVAGLVVGAGLAHNFNTASSAAGPSPYGPIAVLVGLAVCLTLGATMRDPRRVPARQVS
ncbi:MAG: YedE family putative selenium transporter [Anaerolineae bacterium]|jgi:YedE family putative selenium metabolism protein